MGQKTNPIGNRLGIIRGWESNWYASKDYGAKVVADEKIRNYLNARISKGGIARIIIERTLNDGENFEVFEAYNELECR